MSQLKTAAIENRLASIIKDGTVVTDTRSGGQKIMVTVMNGNKDMLRPDELVAVKIGDDESNFYNITAPEMSFIEL